MADLLLGRQVIRRSLLFCGLLLVCVAPAQGALNGPSQAEPGCEGRAPLYKVCKAQFDADDEVNEFTKKENLDACDFEIIDLAEYARPEETGDEWFGRACEAFEKDPSLICDMLLLSGEFSGGFFGSKDYSLWIDTLEKYACNNQCKKILQQPREVFLFGSDTLASKNLDLRTEHEYEMWLRREFQRSGYRLGGLDLNVAIRYNSYYGDSFAARMKRIFPNTPNIYGFYGTKWPSGVRVAEGIKNYFSERKQRGSVSYAEHIAGLYTSQLSAQVNQATEALSTVGYDHPWVPVMRRHGLEFAHGSGVGPDHPVRVRLCQLESEYVPLKEKVSLARELLSAPDFHLYEPTVYSFLKNNEVDIVTEDLFQQLNDPRIHANLDTLQKALSNYPSIVLRVLDIKRMMERISLHEYDTQVKNLVRPFLDNLTAENVDTLCSWAGQMILGVSFQTQDFGHPEQLNTSEGQSVQCCLSVGSCTNK